jgi:SET domain-containing protein
MDDAIQEYRRRAVEVEKLAETAISEEHRRIIRRIAQQWRELADQREQQRNRWAGKMPVNAD